MIKNWAKGVESPLRQLHPVRSFLQFYFVLFVLCISTARYNTILCAEPWPHSASTLWCTQMQFTKSNSLEHTWVTSGSTTKRIRKNIEEYFGEIVPTSNAGRQLAKDKKKTIDDYFGSEVDSEIRNFQVVDSASDKDVLLQTQELIDGIPLPPKWVWNWHTLWLKVRLLKTT